MIMIDWFVSKQDSLIKKILYTENLDRDITGANQTCNPLSIAYPTMSKLGRVRERRVMYMGMLSESVTSAALGRAKRWPSRSPGCYAWQ